MDPSALASSWWTSSTTTDPVAWRPPSAAGAPHPPRAAPAFPASSAAPAKDPATVSKRRRLVPASSAAAVATPMSTMSSLTSSRSSFSSSLPSSSMPSASSSAATTVSAASTPNMRINSSGRSHSSALGLPKNGRAVEPPPAPDAEGIGRPASGRPVVLTDTATHRLERVQRVPQAARRAVAAARARADAVEAALSSSGALVWCRVGAQLFAWALRADPDASCVMVALRSAGARVAVADSVRAASRGGAPAPTVSALWSVAPGGATMLLPDIRSAAAPLELALPLADGERVTCLAPLGPGRDHAAVVGSSRGALYLVERSQQHASSLRAVECRPRLGLLRAFSSVFRGSGAAANGAAGAYGASVAVCVVEAAPGTEEAAAPLVALLLEGGLQLWRVDPDAVRLVVERPLRDMAMRALSVSGLPGVAIDGESAEDVALMDLAASVDSRNGGSVSLHVLCAYAAAPAELGASPVARVGHAVLTAVAEGADGAGEMYIDAINMSYQPPARSPVDDDDEVEVVQSRLLRLLVPHGGPCAFVLSPRRVVLTEVPVDDRGVVDVALDEIDAVHLDPGAAAVSGASSAADSTGLAALRRTVLGGGCADALLGVGTTAMIVVSAVHGVVLVRQYGQPSVGVTCTGEETEEVAAGDMTQRVTSAFRERCRGRAAPGFDVRDRFDQFEEAVVAVGAAIVDAETSSSLWVEEGGAAAAAAAVSASASSMLLIRRQLVLKQSRLAEFWQFLSEAAVGRGRALASLRASCVARLVLQHEQLAASLALREFQNGLSPGLPFRDALLAAVRRALAARNLHEDHWRALGRSALDVYFETPSRADDLLLQLLDANVDPSPACALLLRMADAADESRCALDPAPPESVAAPWSSTPNVRAAAARLARLLKPLVLEDRAATGDYAGLVRLLLRARGARVSGGADPVDVDEDPASRIAALLPRPGANAELVAYARDLADDLARNFEVHEILIALHYGDDAVERELLRRFCAVAAADAVPAYAERLFSEMLRRGDAARLLRLADEFPGAAGTFLHRARPDLAWIVDLAGGAYDVAAKSLLNDVALVERKSVEQRYATLCLSQIAMKAAGFDTASAPDTRRLWDSARDENYLLHAQRVLRSPDAVLLAASKPMTRRHLVDALTEPGSDVRACNAETLFECFRAAIDVVLHTRALTSAPDETRELLAAVWRRAFVFSELPELAAEVEALDDDAAAEWLEESLAHRLAADIVGVASGSAEYAAVMHEARALGMRRYLEMLFPEAADRFDEDQRRVQVFCDRFLEDLAALRPVARGLGVSGVV